MYLERTLAKGVVISNPELGGWEEWSRIVRTKGKFIARHIEENGRFVGIYEAFIWIVSLHRCIKCIKLNPHQTLQNCFSNLKT
jgi:hypothetical protein